MLSLPSRILPALTAALLLLPAGNLSAESPEIEPAVEVSYDGLEIIELDPAVGSDPAPGVGRLAEGAPAIFNLTPDWSNALRIQVGALRVADVNGDQRNDVVVGCYTSNSFPPYPDWENLIYFNTGTELEASPSWTSTDEVSTGDLFVADINGDTFPDIFAANGGTAMAPSVIYFGSASGPSTTPGWSATDSSWTNFAAAFDMDHDGDLDVATANQGNSQLDPFRPMFFYRNNAGALETTPSWQSDEMSIQNFLSWADFDGDGWEDLAVSKWINFESGVYKNVAGNLQTTPIWTTGDTDGDRGVAWADVDNNGDPDLALGHDPTQLFSNTAGVLTSTWSASGAFFGQQDLVAFDVDDDGDPDLAETHFGNGVVNLYLNQNGVLETTPSWSFDSSAVGTAIAFGDINGDGKADLVVGNAGNTSIMVFYNQGSNDDIFRDGFETGDTSAWSAGS